MLSFFYGLQSVSATVSGQCSNCHTMHNSQDNSPLVSVDGDGWDNGVLSAGSITGVQKQLLVTDCVGCHSSSGGETIVYLGSSVIPIVYNTNDLYPAKPLAGGNFAMVPKDHSTGHNVLGIAPEDDKLSVAPGASTPGSGFSIGCNFSCHVSLATEIAEENGCQGCHNRIKHHGVDPAPGDPENEASGWFRFLGNHDASTGGGSVTGIEDSDWEYTKDASDHNIYLGGTEYKTDPEAMGRFCAGCHGLFHADGLGASSNPLGVDNGSPWIRHPADFAIPLIDTTKEYSQLLGQAYDPDVPVAKPNLASYSAGIVEEGDMVMCLSCHRAHGSQYSDMLRWDYTDMFAHNASSDRIDGCFYCHRTKDT